MGYQTEYIISIESEHNQSDLLALLGALTDLTDYNFELSRDKTRLLSDSIKWYEWAEQITSISKDYPEWLILVEGKGEESGDVWKAYFKDGKKKVLQAQITFPEFNESMLE